MRKVIGSMNHIHQYDLREFEGRVFYVTDIHGHFGLLHEAFRDLNFDTSRDLLFVGGDNTDRGPESQWILDYINEPWFISIQGNHEQLYIDGFESHWNPNNSSVRCLAMHGGAWIEDMNNLQKILIHDAFINLPLGIELLLPRGRKVGIIHAEVPYNDWDMFKDVTGTEYDMYAKAEAQWARRWYSSAYRGQVKGVDFVLVGHTPTDTGEVEQLGNMVFCDGGSFFRKKLNMIELNDQFMRNIK